MNALSMFVTVAALGVDIGWQPLADGQFEYIVQLEPQTLTALLAGSEVASDIPSALRGARCYRLTVGVAELPRVGTPAESSTAGPTGAFDITALNESATEIGWQSIEGGGFEFLIQLTPAQFESLAGGEEIRGELPAFLRDVRTYRISLGTQSLPRAEIVVENDQPADGTPAVEGAPASNAINQQATTAAIRDAMVRQVSAEMPPSLPMDAAREVASKTNGPTEQVAGYSQPPTSAATDAPDETGPPSSVPPPPSTLSWTQPYTFVLIGLFASVGANLFLAWVTWDVSQRYRALRRQSLIDHVLSE